MGKWGLSDDEEEEDEEVVEEQPIEEPLAAEQQVEEQQQEEEEVQIPSAQSSPHRQLIGYARGIKYSCKVEDFGRLLNEEGVQFETIEYEMDDQNRFAGKAKVFITDSDSMDNFLKLDEREINGVFLRTKIWERPFKQDRRQGQGQDRRQGGQGGQDRRPREGDRRGGRDGGDRDRQRDDRQRDYDSRPARRLPGSGDARNLSNEDNSGGFERSSGGFDNRNTGRGAGGGGRREPQNRPKSVRIDNDNTSQSLPTPPAASRPRIMLQPLIDLIGKPLNSPSSSIFGAGKPQDINEYEKKKSKDQQDVVLPPSAPAAEISISKSSDNITESVEKLQITVEEVQTTTTAASTDALDEVVEQPPTTSTTGSQSSKRRQKDYKKRSDSEHANNKDEAAASPEYQNKPRNKDNTSNKDKESKQPRDKKFNGEKKPFNKKEKKDHNKAAPVVEQVPVVEEEVIPSDFTVIGNKYKAKPAAAVVKSTPVAAATTTTSQPSKPAVALKNAYAGLLSDDEDSD